MLNNNAWSKDLINNAENNCKFSHEYHYILFPDGDLQILQEFESWLDDHMLSALNKIERPKKIRDQIALALETRIIDLITKDAAISISAYHILPQNICAANESAFKTCDVIWKYAGDKSTDFNYYSKRGLLFPVYLSAKAFYFADLLPRVYVLPSVPRASRPHPVRRASHLDVALITRFAPASQR